MKFKQLTPILTGFALLLTGSSCFNTTPEKKPCPTPVAFFMDTMEHVAEHNFELKDGKSTEFVRFEEEFSLEIQQSGCEKRLTVFTFSIPGDFSKGRYNWAEMAADYFYQVSGVSSTLKDFEDWAVAIGSHAKDFQPGQENFIESYGVKIDPGVGADYVLLAVQVREL